MPYKRTPREQKKLDKAVCRLKRRERPPWVVNGWSLFVDRTFYDLWAAKCPNGCVFHFYTMNEAANFARLNPV